MKKIINSEKYLIKQLEQSNNQILPISLLFMWKKDGCKFKPKRKENNKKTTLYKLLRQQWQEGEITAYDFDFKKEVWIKDAIRKLHIKEAVETCVSIGRSEKMEKDILDTARQATTRILHDFFRLKIWQKSGYLIIVPEDGTGEGFFFDSFPSRPSDEEKIFWFNQWKFSARNLQNVSDKLEKPAIALTRLSEKGLGELEKKKERMEEVRKRV